MNRYQLLDPETWVKVAERITVDPGYYYDSSDTSHMIDMAQLVCESLAALDVTP